jgi:hypothetical protein
MINAIFLSVLFLLGLTSQHAFMSSRISVPTRHFRLSTPFMSADDYDLDVGDFEQCVFKKAAVVKDNISKYTLDATIDAKALNSYLVEYQEEMKRRKVVFPGFRPGKLPPYVMGDVRRYLVCYGLETMIGTLCNSNGLKVKKSFNTCSLLDAGFDVFEYHLCDSLTCDLANETHRRSITTVMFGDRRGCFVRRGCLLR